MAKDLWRVARLAKTSKAAFAKEMGLKSASGGGWDRKIAVLKGFQLIDRDGDQIGLSSLGQQLVNESNPLGQEQARRVALMNLKAYKELVDAFEGTTVPEVGSLASRLQFDYGKKEDFAKIAASAFIKSLVHAKMIDENNIVHASSGGSKADVTEMSGQDSRLDSNEGDLDDEAEIDAAFAEEDEIAEVNEDLVGGESEGRSDGEAITLRKRLPGDFKDRDLTTEGAGNISLSISLDLSKYRADEVISILHALGIAR
ncbi:hypothetical protein OG439_14325 [Amycolatopsis sp. NBC_01307]|uniref:hypothetical protein n=1 Tax=Amycolatopsis sp. NBC_01307 TaxID=2903561 RepID=UPI002E14FD1A|nr:hypothetical protein OG439_14325 [Amycolatopsis sp. NBC_01307]